MTAKLTPPPLVPSAEERATLAVASFHDQGTHRTVNVAIAVAARDSAAAMLDAVIALLREPDEAMINIASQRDIRPGFIPRANALLHALADELERRKP